MNSKWGPEHEQASRGGKKSRHLCFVYLLLPGPVCIFCIKSSLLKRLIQNLQCHIVRNKNNASEGKSDSSSQIAVNRGASVGWSHFSHRPQLWLGCQWDIWPSGWGRQEGLGVVIKLPLFLQGSLRCSNSTLIGQWVPWQPGTLSA